MCTQGGRQSIAGEMDIRGERQDLLPVNAEVNREVLQLHDGLSKRQSAILVQIHTEKIRLNDFRFLLKSTRRYGRQIPLPGRTTNGVARPVAMLPIPITPML
ncbi:hypothetical protein EDB81DRAFT_335231 [Dactylonectria macrodidyma]|uniref:Uncharacterized protein n=1 Tax=Dactylonectria macrodidyma TaxID=307937 RepID=A0A9P9JJH8_9HYPO|nr:hypothetical protein EDB81DRAFT_335231 [Dactylonectria macrodidyma]